MSIVFVKSLIGFRLSLFVCFFFQAEDGIRDLVRSRGLGDVYKRQDVLVVEGGGEQGLGPRRRGQLTHRGLQVGAQVHLSLIHI